MSRTRWVLVFAVLLCAASATTWTLVADEGPVPVQRQDHVLTGAGGVRLDSSYYRTDGGGKRPAVVLAHGFGGTKDSERDRAERLARAGYAVLTYSARGFGASGGRIGLNAPDGEVADTGHLLDWLAARPEVLLQGTRDPVVGMAGGSYGGAVSLLAAAADRRIDALVPSLTYWDLEQSLFPRGVFKKMWAGVFFGQGLTDPHNPLCGRFTAEVCEAFRRSAVTGRADDGTRELLRKVSPAAYGEHISVPTLLVQGQGDSLFPLAQADAAASAVAKNGASVAVDWIAGGHDGGDTEDARIADRTAAWFDAHLRGGADGASGKGASAHTDAGSGGPGFRVSRSATAAGPGADRELHGASTARYPGLEGTERVSMTFVNEERQGRPGTPSPGSGARNAPGHVPGFGTGTTLGDGSERVLINPAGGSPPTVTGLPGLGALAQLASGQSGPAGTGGPGGPRGAGGHGHVGQDIAFTGTPLKSPLHVTGAPSVDLTVRTDGRAPAPAVLFVKLYDVAPDGRQTLPGQLVAPVRVPSGSTVRLALPAVDHLFAAGHRMRVVVSSTDLQYASPAAPAVHRVRAAALTVPTVAALTPGTTGTVPAWTWMLPLVALGAAVVLLVTGRRRFGTTPAPDPALADVPLRIEGLGKAYPGGGGRPAVRGLSFTVERGQVLGLLGPNGAGKTTTLRMLMGLVRPDSGELRIFGHPVRPGAPVLSRLGSFVEGPGFLPHLTGRQNLDLYWRATGRPAADAHTDRALDVAALGEALDRRLRTYSQGMRQRLALAQAMLGLPDLLVLDEPTNGLDPGQIREMRDVLIRYAATGRTVVVSSHLLAEVEQCCTHLVVMDRGELVVAGPVGEIAGDGGHLEDAFLTLTGGENR
ncbi:alpha/beta fold hydrolase [Streptomyces sp. CA-294286]|uniref:alpha/beta fold hydrolase n=1 Tax=Streptomyces sp. CA-294286 TaxID=3240070 RepID=UPI003D91B317